MRLSEIILNDNFLLWSLSINYVFSIINYDILSIICQLKYLIGFEMTNVSTATWKMTLFIEWPNILFPVGGRWKIVDTAPIQ